MSRIDEAIPWDECPYIKNNANTFVRARAYSVFRLHLSASTLGAPLGACSTLREPPRLIPPHLVHNPLQTHLLKYCNITHDLHCVAMKLIIPPLHCHGSYTSQGKDLHHIWQ